MGSSIVILLLLHLPPPLPLCACATLLSGACSTSRCTQAAAAAVEQALRQCDRKNYVDAGIPHGYIYQVRTYGSAAAALAGLTARLRNRACGCLHELPPPLACRLPAGLPTCRMRLCPFHNLQDGPLPLGYNETISAPHMHGK